MPAFCAVLNCSDKYGHVERISFFRFPFKRKDLMDKWLKFAGRGEYWVPSKWSTICSRHFREDDFNSANERKTLKKSAIPTVQLEISAAQLEQEERTKAQKHEKGKESEQETKLKKSMSKLLEKVECSEPQEAVKTATVLPVAEKQRKTVEIAEKNKEEHCISMTKTAGKLPKFQDERELDDLAENTTIPLHDFPKVNCRFCGHASSSAVTFIANFEIYGMIQKCFPTLNIQQDDNLPKDICRVCLKRLDNFSRFIDKVLETQSELQRKFQTHEMRTQKNSVSEKALIIKQEPVVRVKQEVAENFNNLLSDDMDMGMDEMGCEQEPDSEEDHKYRLSDYPMLNSQDIINNCDIMEIINLDDPFIDIPDDDANTNCTDEQLSTAAFPMLQQQQQQQQQQQRMADQTRMHTAHELLQAHMLIEEHNYAYAAEDFKDEWQIKDFYKTEKVEEGCGQEATEEMCATEVEEYATEESAVGNPLVGPISEHTLTTAVTAATDHSDNRSTKPIVTSISDLAESRPRLPLENPATATMATERNKDTRAKAKPNIVVLNESIVKSSTAFQLHACNICQSKFFSMESLGQHYAIAHQQHQPQPQQQQQDATLVQQQQQQQQQQIQHSHYAQDAQQQQQQSQLSQNVQQATQQSQLTKSDHQQAPHQQQPLQQQHQHQQQQPQHMQQQQQQQQQQHHHQLHLNQQQQQYSNYLSPHQSVLPMVSVPSGNILSLEQSSTAPNPPLPQHYKREKTTSMDEQTPLSGCNSSNSHNNNQAMHYNKQPAAAAPLHQLPNWQHPERNYQAPYTLGSTQLQQHYNILDNMQQTYMRQQEPCYGTTTLVQNYYNTPQGSLPTAPQPPPPPLSSPLLPLATQQQLHYANPAQQLPYSSHTLGQPNGSCSTSHMDPSSAMEPFKKPKPPVVHTDCKRLPLRRAKGKSRALPHIRKLSLEKVLAYYRQLRWRFAHLQRKYRNMQEGAATDVRSTPAGFPAAATVQRYRCRLCTQSFANIKRLLRHKQTAPAHHIRQPHRFFATCYGCDKFFCSRKALRNHMRYICQTLPLRWFKTQLQTFKCRHCCSITFTHWRLYRRHEMKCQLKSSYQQWRRQQRSVKQAQRRHNMPFGGSNSCSRSRHSCCHTANVRSFCRRRSVRSSSRRRSRSRSRERVHRCTLCPCIFKRRLELQQHMKGFHLQLKPHVCVVCRRRYALKCDMLRCGHGRHRTKHSSA